MTAVVLPAAELMTVVPAEVMTMVLSVILPAAEVMAVVPLVPSVVLPVMEVMTVAPSAVLPAAKVVTAAPLVQSIVLPVMEAMTVVPSVVLPVAEVMAVVPAEMPPAAELPSVVLSVPGVTLVPSVVLLLWDVVSRGRSKHSDGNDKRFGCITGNSNVEGSRHTQSITGKTPSITGCTMLHTPSITGGGGGGMFAWYAGIVHVWVIV
jgi:hypothetical protein